MHNSSKLRNIAIIAHVDHGKTTLVDGFLKQTHMFRDNQAEMGQTLIMDSGDQERERGITITAKITAVDYKDTHINIIDTPGHADFGGEVERTLHMADGCLLIVDAQEGPMPQTKFVLKKALAAGLKPIVVINKIDKPGARLGEVEDELGDLFLELATHEDQLHYSIYYAIGREGKAWSEVPADPSADGDLSVIFEAIVRDIPAPNVTEDGDVQLLVTALDWDSYQGKYAIGLLKRGTIKPGDNVALATPEGVVSRGKIDKLLTYQGLGRVESTTAGAGEIIAVTGLSAAHIGETITNPENPDALPIIEIEPPALSMYLGPNTSPQKGKEAEFSTGRQVGERLQRELETNIGLRVGTQGIGFVVSGRGELHLSVLIEAMRREGYEFEVGRPQVVTIEENGKTLEPFEEITIEVPNEYSGAVQSELGLRRAEITGQSLLTGDRVRIIATLPTRALLGLRNLFITATRGTIVMSSEMIGYQPLGIAVEGKRNGALVAWEAGTTTAYALQMAEGRGTVFVGPGEKVYGGQIVGLNTRSEDIDMNVVKEKHLTNMRSSSSDGIVHLVPATRFSLEQNLDFLADDELLEVTPKSLRLRKRELDRNIRAKQK
ncbi:translational GTPase TypA [Candidatus Saccharibacteria bacterium]|nr:translational GTPase TypA [Candidatus Saccharibacteria bacterium]